MNLAKLLTHVSIAIVTVIGTIQPIRSNELGPAAVLNAVYRGLRKVDGTRANPPVRWDVQNGVSTPCGPVGGSMYCSTNNTIYITKEQIQMAYQHGDAALAYILAHEYAHAVQVASGIKPSNPGYFELQADCLAGYYMGVIPDVFFDGKDIGDIVELAVRIGDYEYNNPNHHGTPKQRKMSVLLGFKASQRQNGISTCQFR